MRIASLVPTRDRAVTAIRAVHSFLFALCEAAPDAALSLAIIDDSTDAREREALSHGLSDLYSICPRADIVVVPPTGFDGGGPGAARNRGLAWLRRAAPDASVTLMFDDDMCFADTDYRGRTLTCDGVRLLRDVLTTCREGDVVVGCPYLGRQDLSILEHAQLALDDRADRWHVSPSLDRADIGNVAPGGISTAFLAISESPSALPDFPEHYNEDYVWLYALDRAGWALRRMPWPLIHAPPGDVAVTRQGLGFQIFGEIVWLAVLENARYPVADNHAMAAAVAEIAGDLRAALRDGAVVARPPVAHIITDTLGWCGAIERQFATGELGADARRLRLAIEEGLALGTA